MENTGRNNEAIIVLWTSGGKDGADLAALGAWLARAGASAETKNASRASREAQYDNSHYCHKPTAEGAQGLCESIPSIHG
jgi:hypothetical protein